MKKSYMLRSLVMAILLALINSTTHAQTTIAYDDAANYGESWEGNGGYGFYPWDIWADEGATAGSFLEDSHGGLIDTDGRSFGLWASSSFKNAQRLFGRPLTTDQEFIIEMSVHWRDGARGIDLLDDDFENLFNFNINNDGYGATGWSYAENSHITMRVVQIDNNNFQVFLRRQNDNLTWVSGELEGQVAGFKAYVGDTSGGGGNDFYINSPRIIQGGRINLADGVRMPGDWHLDGSDNWINETGMGGDFDLVRTTIGTWRWQTTFEYSGTTGNQNFKFASTGFEDPWRNQWATTGMTVNTMADLTYTTNGSSANNTILLTNGKYYTVLFQDRGYTDTRAIFMETSAMPVGIVTVTQNPGVVETNDDVTITATLSETPSPEERFYLRYTTDAWETSTAIAMTEDGSEATATIPGQASDTEVSWYVFSSVFAELTADFDMRTLRINNNAGNNYTYTVDQQAECAALALATNPAFPQQAGTLTITLNTSLGNAALADYEGDIYVHTGVITDQSANSSDWRYVKTDWGVDTEETKLTAVPGEDHLYTLTIDDIRTYYGVPVEEDILQLAMIFRSANVAEEPYLIQRNADGSDFLVEIYEPALNVKLLSPSGRNILLGADRLITVCAAALENDELSIYLNDELVETVTVSEISTLVSFHGLPAGEHTIRAVATDASKGTAEATTIVFIREALPIAELPEPVASITDRKDIPGIHYHDDDQGATLVLHDPPGLKKFAFVIGDFNDWQMTPEHYMNRTPNGQYFWADITGLEPDTEYAYQYFIDDELRLADPYAEKVLDPWNDHWISDFNYPNLKSYPHGKTTGTASVLHPGRPEYDWQVTEFQRPDVRDLVIYELHIRDFVETDAIKSVEEKLDYLEALGVNAIELMPINQFEGNDSWGYNPSFYFATDKAYGTREDYKRFIDAAHERSMAVILDIVLNHSFNMSPFAQMYFDEDAGEWGQPTPDNPWYLTGCPPGLPWCWGNTFDQDSPYTHELFHRILVYWLEEFNIDGYRFDFTKGFSNVPSGNDGNDYDQARVNNLKRIADQVWTASPHAYVILEHLTANEEEVELSNYGMLIWGNMDHQYAEAAMGYENGSDLSWGLHTERGYGNHNLLSYMESHDEERMMHRMLNHGNEYNSDHNVRDLDVALARAGLAAAFYFVAPGPKMIWQFGELGYDFPINHCPDGTVSEDCRTSRKPIPWSEELDYFNHPERRQLFDVYSRLIRLKTSQPVFRTGNINHDLGGYLKRLHLNENMDGSGQKVTLLGNFDVVARDITPYFQETGTWYEYFTGDVLEVTNTEQNINLQPGEYRLYSDEPFHPAYYSSNTGNLDDLSNWGNNVDGTGSQPTNFTEDWTYYHVRNNVDPVINNPLTISGENSRLIVGDRNTPINLTIAAEVEVGIIEVTTEATLTVAPGQHLTVNERLLNRGTIVLEPGAMLTVEGNISNIAGTEALVLESGINSKDGNPTTASLIHHTPGVEAKVERHVVATHDWPTSNDGWHLLSSPVEEQPISAFTTAGDDGDYDFYGWDEQENLWRNQKAAGWEDFNDGNLFNPGWGYLVAWEQSHDFAFEGILHIRDLEVSDLIRSEESPFAGWHLLGNPFPAALKWNDGNWDLQNIAGSAQIWDRAAKSYLVIQANEVIPAAQGFFVQVDQGSSGSLTIPAASRTHEPDTWHKSVPSDRIVLAARDLDNGGLQRSIIRFHPEATEGYDSRFDSRFLAGYAPQFYSVNIHNERLAAYTLPEMRDDLVIPMGFEKNASTNFRIELKETIPTTTIYLKDKRADKMHRLTADNPYAFQFLTGDDPGRFEVHFQSGDSSTDVPIPGDGETLKVWAHNNVLYVDNPLGNSELHLYNVSGQRLRTFDVLAGQHQFDLNLPPGLYFVRTPGNQGHEALKIVVKRR